MDERARDILYKQLVEMAELNIKADATPIVTRDTFMNMSEEEVLKYVFDYRDKQTQFEVNGVKASYYIEMPNIDLNGRDLSKTYLSRFVLSHGIDDKQREPSRVNLGNTNAVINLTDLGYSMLTTTDRRTDEEIIDFEIVDFRGCNLYGILPDEYQEEDATGLQKRVVVKGKDRLDERYLRRREEHHLSSDEKAIADRAYKRLLNGESFYRMRGNGTKIDLTDYDMTAIEDIENFCDNFTEYNMQVTLFTQEQMDILTERLLPSVSFRLLNGQQLDGAMQKREDILTKLGVSRALFRHYSGEKSFETEIYRLYEMLNLKEKGILISSGLLNQIAERWWDNDIKVQWRNYGYWSCDKLTYEEFERNVINSLLNAMPVEENIEFYKEHFEKFNYRIQNKILKKMFELEQIEFVEQNFEKLGDSSDRAKILVAMCNQGRTEFVEQNFEKLGDSSDRAKVLVAMCNQGRTEFVEQNFEKLMDSDSSGRADVLVAMCNQGRTEFVEQNFEKPMTSSDRAKVLLAMCNQGRTEFVEQNFEKLMTPSDRAKVLLAMCNQGRIEFVEQNFEKLEYSSDRADALVAMCNQGKTEFVEQNFEKLMTPSDRTKVLVAMCNHGKAESMIKQFESLKILNQKRDVLTEIFKNEEIRLQHSEQLDRIIDSYLQSENRETEIQGRKEVSSSGRLLYEVLEKNKSVNKELALNLIRAGSGVNYTAYNNGHGVISYTPTLYKAMQIEDDEVRREIVQAMVEAGVDIGAQKVEINFNRSGTRSKTNEYCMDMRDGELKKFTQVRKDEPILHSRTIPKPRTQKATLDTFLSDNVGLSVDEVETFKSVYSQYGRDLVTIAPAKLEIKGRILEACGAKKELFTTNVHASMLNEEVLYARLMFFREQKIEIKPEELSKTMALTQKQFANTYGAKLGIFKGRDVDVRDHINNVNRKLRQLYPMPRSHDELRRKLEEVSVKKEVD